MSTRTLRRVAAAILLPLGPLSIAVLRGVMPYSTAESTGDMIAHTAANPDRQDAVLWLTLLMILTVIPSALAGARLAQRRAPVLSLLSVALLVPAFSALFFSTNDAALRVLSGPDVDPAAGAKLLDALLGSAPVAVGSMMFVAGHIVGLILLGAALWKSRGVPAWAALAVIVSQPLHVFFAVIAPNHLLDALAWGLAAFGLGVAGLRVLKTPDSDWDLA